jgi:sensor histidine kinase YesM
LQPGEYQFEVHAQNENGVWSSEPAHVFLLIQKPFWERWWFVLLIFLLVLGGIVLIVAFFFRVKFKESQKRNQLHNNLNRLKQEALAQQMNPHFIFNSLGSIQYYINENDIKASNKYLTMFSNLMRMTLNNSHKKNVSIHEEIKALEMYIQLEQLRFSDKFEYRIYIDPAIDTNKYIMPSLMLQPFVENAIWHGIMHKSTNDGLIEVRLTKQGLLLEYLIRDNGIGRRKSSEINAQKRKSHQSLGSKITESRLQLISSLYGDALSIEYKDLKDLNKENCGTEVRITLPILSVK